MKGIIALIIVIAAIIAVAVFYCLGMIPGVESPDFGGLNLGDEKSYPDADYCGFSDIEILNMLEIATGKDLNNQVGLGFVSSLDMQACGVNDKTTGEIMSYYNTEYSDWYTYFDDTGTGPGYDVRLIIWTNDPAALNSTFAKSVVVFDGVTVEETYGYDTILISSEGTVAIYVAFLAWVNSS